MQPCAQKTYSHHYTEPSFCSFDDINDCCQFTPIFILTRIQPHPQATTAACHESTAVVASLLLILNQTKEKKPQHSTKPFRAIFLPWLHHALVMSCEARRVMQGPEAACSKRRRSQRGALHGSGAAPTKGTQVEREARPGDVSPCPQAPATPT